MVHIIMLDFSQYTAVLCTEIFGTSCVIILITLGCDVHHRDCALRTNALHVSAVPQTGWSFRPSGF